MNIKGITLTLKYILYLIKSQTKHDIHSPFVYNLVTKAINRREKKPVFHAIEKIRKALLADQTKINIRDFGAGFGGKKFTEKKVSFITANSSKSPKYSRLLHRLVDYFSPLTMLELGTSVGISGIYQISAAPAAAFTSLEGCENTAALAKQNFLNAGFGKVHLIIGDFEETLPAFLSGISSIDYVFIDGNHRKDPVLNYFNQCIKKINKNSMIIVDDINWSAEMQEAWNEIKLNPRVSVTVDLFMLGLVFFNPDLSKEDFTIRF